MKFSLSSKILLLLLMLSSFGFAQTERWQQRAEYTMEIDMDVTTHRYAGKQKLVYQNNSPETLTRVFYHLYFNAFQPGSMMDVRSRTIIDPSPKIGDRISTLKDNEIGFQKITSLKQNGQDLKFEHVGTILEVELAKPIAPGQSATFDMVWDAQIPAQVRRSGRNNKEGIDYSMTQWYPKMCEYDFMGWHANPYVGREFYGIWGDFDVKINIDKKYIIGGTGNLQNPNEIGYGYEAKGAKVNRPDGEKLEWHFVAKNVHDFAWAADPDYQHLTAQVPNGPTLHFLYQLDEKTMKTWPDLPEATVKAFQFIEKSFGKYPYKQYTVIQGGDGGMEYPMATLITGHRPFSSLIGVTVHEIMHTWYQMLMGTNEALYAWMDEGFTSYGSVLVMDHLYPKEGNIFDRTYRGYLYLAKAQEEEPLSTHADHFETNSSYGIASYGKGAVFLHQLGYVIGQENLDKGLLRYYDDWKFKHPHTNDFIRVMEKQSGLELDWYKEYFVNSVKRIDYGIESVTPGLKKTTRVTLERIEPMPMPIDVYVEYSDGSTEIFNIPLRIMRGNKAQEFADMKYTVIEDWPWTNPTYTFSIPQKMKKIKSIKIDPTLRMADINLDNNTFGTTE